MIGADSAMPFIKQAAARHSSNTTAEALTYLAVNLTGAMQGSKHAGKAVKPGQVTQARFGGGFGPGLAAIYIDFPYYIVYLLALQYKKCSVSVDLGLLPYACSFFITLFSYWHFIE